MSTRCVALLVIVTAAACGTGDSSPDPASRLAAESARFVESAVPGMSWARSGGGGGTRVSQRTYQLRTLTAVPAEATAGLVAKLRERVLAVLEELGAEIHGRGTTGTEADLEAFRLRFDIGPASGTYAAWSARLEDGHQLIVVSATAYRP
ncbi:MAG: hypothetical protein ACYTGN_12565 [Planctomycetota bacterium]|jgi:hypothetical protein